MRLAWLLALAVALPGCTVYPEPGPRDVAGATDGYAPTASFLKVLVRPDEGDAVWVVFERRDWHVSELARRIDEREVRHLSVHGQERVTLGEVLAIEVTAPADLQRLHYDEMGATAQQREAFDLEYEDLLRRKASDDVGLPSLQVP